MINLNGKLIYIIPKKDKQKYYKKHIYILKKKYVIKWRMKTYHV